MSRVISTKQRADDFAPQTGAGGSARNGDGTAAAGDGNPEGSGSAATGPDGRERARFDVGGLPEEAVVFLDGEPLPQLPVLVEISDVPRTLRVEAPGWIPFEKTVTIPGETKITIEMEKAPGSKKKGGKPSVEEPPIDTTYPAVVRKKN